MSKPLSGILPILWIQSLKFVIRADKVILHRRRLIASDYGRAPSDARHASELARIEQFLETDKAWLA